MLELNGTLAFAGHVLTQNMSESRAAETGIIGTRMMGARHDRRTPAGRAGHDEDEGNDVMLNPFEKEPGWLPYKAHEVDETTPDRHVANTFARMLVFWGIVSWAIIFGFLCLMSYQGIRGPDQHNFFPGREATQ